jgi:hypothetical protein
VDVQTSSFDALKAERRAQQAERRHKRTMLAAYNDPATPVQQRVACAIGLGIRSMHRTGDVHECGGREYFVDAHGAWRKLAPVVTTLREVV